MSVLARVLAGLLLALSLVLPAAAVQPRGSAGWTTDGWTNFSGTLYHGPGTKYDVTGHVEAGIRIRVDRCSALWCLIHTRSDIGWMSLDNISFGQGPWKPFVRTPKFPIRYGGTTCFYTGANYSGREFCYAGGHTFKDLYLVGLDNAFRSVRVDGGSALVCRDRNFRSYCVIINESKPHLERLLNASISSVRIY